MKLDRMIGILSVLLQGGQVTAPELAARFEVSRRTINRDIEALSRAGIPVATRQGAGGGISIMEGYGVDRALLTRADMRSILAGLRSLDSVSGTRQYAQLMEKLSAGSSAVIAGDERMLIDLASWYGPSLSEKIGRIQGAMDASRRVRFCYHAPSGDSDRDVEPGCLVFRWSSWYLWGRCLERRDYRLFKLNRMTGLQVGEPFESGPVPLPDLDNARVFPAKLRVEALVEPGYRWRLIEEYGADSFEERPDGRLLFRFGFAEPEEALRWILSVQGGAELIEPRELRAALRAVGERLVKQYGEEAGK